MQKIQKEKEITITKSELIDRYVNIIIWAFGVGMITGLIISDLVLNNI